MVRLQWLSKIYYMDDDFGLFLVPFLASCVYRPRTTAGTKLPGTECIQVWYNRFVGVFLLRPYYRVKMTWLQPILLLYLISVVFWLSQTTNSHVTTACRHVGDDFLTFQGQKVRFHASHLNTSVSHGPKFEISCQNVRDVQNNFLSFIPWELKHAPKWQ